jgi:hypothetical protein
MEYLIHPRVSLGGEVQGSLDADGRDAAGLYVPLLTCCVISSVNYGVATPSVTPRWTARQLSLPRSFLFLPPLFACPRTGTTYAGAFAVAFIINL